MSVVSAFLNATGSQALFEEEESRQEDRKRQGKSGVLV
jgi:hypothetical protein